MCIGYMDPSACPPKGVTSGQALRVVVTYIDAIPARMHENFKYLAVEALRAAWPCK
jgi:Rap1a immunity proteins